MFRIRENRFRFFECIPLNFGLEGSVPFCKFSPLVSLAGVGKNDTRLFFDPLEYPNTIASNTIAMKISHLLILPALSALLVACSANEPVEPVPELKDTSWALPQDPKDGCDAAPYIEFSATKVTGDMGCNSFSAEYTLKGNTLTFKNPAATLRMCDAKTMQVESKMQKIFTDTRRVRGNEKELTFLDAKGKVILTLVPETMGACK